jgi:hypothetical protein
LVSLLSASIPTLLLFPTFRSWFHQNTTIGDNEHAVLIDRINTDRDNCVENSPRLASMMLSRYNQSVDHADDLPPSYSQATTPPLPSGRWELACNIGVQDLFLQLNAEGEAIWTQVSKEEYRRDEFIISLGLPQITVTNQAYKWSCDANTEAGQLLMTKRDVVSLRSVRGRLFVFERTVVATNPFRPKPQPCEDEKGCLKVLSQSSNIWTINGTDIYQVEGDGEDVIIRSPRFVRLWNMTKAKYWEKRYENTFILALTPKFVVLKLGRCHMVERKTGRRHGDFDLPATDLTYVNDNNHFGPVVSPGGLFLYKPGRKTLIIFRIGDEKVDARVWKSATDIQGFLLLRGELDNLEIELVGSQPTWTKSIETCYVYRETDLIKKYFIW